MIEFNGCFLSLDAFASHCQILAETPATQLEAGLYHQFTCSRHRKYQQWQLLTAGMWKTAIDLFQEQVRLISPGFIWGRGRTSQWQEKMKKSMTGTENFGIFDPQLRPHWLCQRWTFIGQPKLKMKTGTKPLPVPWLSILRTPENQTQLRVCTPWNVTLQWSTVQQSSWFWTQPSSAATHLHLPWPHNWRSGQFWNVEGAELTLAEKAGQEAKPISRLSRLMARFKQFPTALHGILQDLNNARVKSGKLCLH